VDRACADVAADDAPAGSPIAAAIASNSSRVAVSRPRSIWLMIARFTPDALSSALIVIPASTRSSRSVRITGRALPPL
jgi:hypothetical protein